MYKHHCGGIESFWYGHHSQATNGEVVKSYSLLLLFLFLKEKEY